MKILIADDHTVVRKGLMEIVKDMPEVEEVDEAANATDVMQKVENKIYDVLVLDISMPGKSGLDILKDLKISVPDLHVLMLSTYPEELYAVRALKAGASGYLNKNTATEELTIAIRKVAAGRKYISSSLAEQLAVNIGSNSDKLPHERLSDREFQVFRLVAEGKTLTEISESLFLSNKTVSTYKTRILEKMDLKSSTEITRYAITNQIIE